jgi:hypothetical protein
MTLIFAALTLVAAASALHPSLGYARGSVDRGRGYNDVPVAFRSTTDLGYGSARSIWRMEWTTCGGDTMLGLARDPDIRLAASRLHTWLAISPQYAAHGLAVFIETGSGGAGYSGRSLVAAEDGCRNGILFRYYHGWLYK